METYILKVVLSMLKVCTDPLPEYENWNFARGTHTYFSLPLGLKQFSGSPNK